MRMGAGGGNEDTKAMQALSRACKLTTLYITNGGTCVEDLYCFRSFLLSFCLQRLGNPSHRGLERETFLKYVREDFSYILSFLFLVKPRSWESAKLAYERFY